MQKGQISVETENIFPIIKKFLYSDHEIFLREIISNAVDATSKLNTLASKGDFKGTIGETTIDIILDEDQKTLTVRDRGIGMSEAEVKKYLNQVAFSSAEDFLKKYKDDTAIIGHFGLGFYSAFMVSDKVEVHTRSHKKSVSAVHWVCDGDPAYEIGKSDKKERGTDIIMHINEENNEFLKKERIEALLNKYCRFLPIQIRFGTKTESTWEGEGDDRKEIKTEVDNLINNTSPIWKKKPAKLEDEDYKNFYNELYPYSQAPLFWIHLNIDFPFNLTGILYFPKLNNSLEVQKNKIQLYSNQVYITDDVKEIVPEFLTLLHGVIDSPDIPLNVSRSYLQSDSNVKKITGYITKKVAEKLKGLYKNDREAYESKWDEINVFVKYGMISEEKFYDKAKDICLLKSIDGSFSTIEEYKEKIKDTQKDKYDKKVILYALDRKEQHSYIEAVKPLGYDVVLMDNVIDNHYMQHIEQKEGDITFVRVDSDIPQNLVQKEENQDSVLSEKEQNKVKEIFESVLADEKNKISLQAMSPDNHPITITKPEFMRRMQEMQSLQGMNMPGMMDSFQIVVNTNNSLIAEKLIRMKSEEKRSDFAKYLYNLALLNQNMLKGQELSDFISKSLEFAQ